MPWSVCRGLRAILFSRSVLLLPETELRSSTWYRSLGSKSLYPLSHLSAPPSLRMSIPGCQALCFCRHLELQSCPFLVSSGNRLFALYPWIPCFPCGKLSASKALQLCHRPLSLGEGSCFDLKCGVWLSKDRGFVDRHLPQSPTEVKKEGLPAGDGVGIHKSGARTLRGPYPM